MTFLHILPRICADLGHKILNSRNSELRLQAYSSNPVENVLKMAKKATVALKGGAFVLYGSWGHDIRVRSSPIGVFEPTKTIRIICTILLKIFM